MAARAILLIALVVFIPSAVVRASDNPKYVGSTNDLPWATSKSDIIFVGTITNSGTKTQLPTTIMYAGTAYGGIKVKVLSVLRGSVGSRASVCLIVDTTVHEERPAVGGAYIFFVVPNEDQTPDPFYALKLLPATDDNIARARKLISN
jgi:hypothetical protein